MALFACKIGGSEGAVHTGLMIDATEQKYSFESLTTSSNNSGRCIFAILDGKYTTLRSSSSTVTPYKTLDANFNQIANGNLSVSAPANLANAMYVFISVSNTSLNNATFSIS